ncbi:MAG: DUF374 domain-containing protein [Nitrospirae bacterium]|nr:DUF374 domain-containing protein [Nitrospirota bacterium]
MKNRIMGNSFLYRYKVDNVPLILQPVFYLYSYFVALILVVYTLIVHFTSKIEIVGQEHLDAQRNYIFCYWHTFVPLYGCVFLRNRSHVWMQHPFWFMKSIHLFLRFRGAKKIILGSTGHSGREAADELVEYLKKGYSTVLLPDGPSGPAFVAKKGMLHISLQSQVPIVPMQFKASKAFESHGWDRKKWPMPFSTIKVRFGKPILISDDNIDEAYGEITKALG